MRRMFNFLMIVIGMSVSVSVHGADAMKGSTFWGGSGADGSWPTSVHTVDDQGYVYLTGVTDSSDSPVTGGAWDTTFNGGDGDCFVAKFTSDLNTLVAATFIGGSEFDSGVMIACGDDGWITVLGQTESGDFPVVSGCYDTTYNGSAAGPYGSGDTFALRISADLTQVTAATYLGGAGHDVPTKLVLDGSGRVVIAGHTNSQDFPATAGAYATVKAGAPLSEDCYVAILSSDLTGLESATYLGGSGNDFIETLGVNAAGAVYIGGWLSSTDFPTTPGAFDTDYNGYYYDGFVALFSADLSTLDGATYLGGSSWEFVYAMALDEDSNVYVAGHTASTDYPVTAGAYDTTYNSQQGAGVGDDVFVTRLTADLTGVAASTYLGGSGWENAYGLVVSPDLGLMVCGSTSSSDFPIGDMAWQPEFHGGSRNAGDLFITRMDTDLTVLTASTYLGGTGDDGGQWMTLNDPNELVISGYTASNDYPVTFNAWQTQHAGGAFDACLTRLDVSLTADPTPTPTAPDTPTPIPTSPCTLGVTLWMPCHQFGPTDPCCCMATVCNDTAGPLEQYPLFVILDVAGMLFFAPGFSSDFDHYLAQYPSFPPGETQVEVLPEFQWPSGAGEASGILFYAGLTNPQMTKLVGDFDVWEFGWTDAPTPVPMTFVELPAGIFEMGAPVDEMCREDDEIFFTVTLTQPLAVQTTEVTQHQWETVFGSNPSQFTGINRPVERITWFDACIFCNRLSLSDGLTPCYYADESFSTVFDGEPPVSTGPVFWKHDADGYRLPTEAEWEYACRAGTHTAYYSGETGSACDRDPLLDPLAWYKSTSNTGNGRETHPAGQKMPNSWGIYNMHGNVGEWCWDWYGPYPLGSAIDPAGPETGTERINRGGAFNYIAAYCRSANRWYDAPDSVYNYYGLRLVKNIP